MSSTSILNLMALHSQNYTDQNFFDQDFLAEEDENLENETEDQQEEDETADDTGDYMPPGCQGYRVTLEGTACAKKMCLQ